VRIRLYFGFLCLIDAYQNLSGRISSQFSKNCFNWFLAHWQELQIISRFDILSAPPCFSSTGWTCSIVTEQGSLPGAEALVILVPSHCGHSLPTCESRKARTFGFRENLRDCRCFLFVCIVIHIDSSEVASLRWHHRYRRASAPMGNAPLQWRFLN